MMKDIRGVVPLVEFLKYVGFSTAAATIAACEGPVIKSVPYVVQPEQIRPGIQLLCNYHCGWFDFGSTINIEKEDLLRLKVIQMHLL